MGRGKFLMFQCNLQADTIAKFKTKYDFTDQNLIENCFLRLKMGIYYFYPYQGPLPAIISGIFKFLSNGEIDTFHGTSL